MSSLSAYHAGMAKNGILGAVLEPRRRVILRTLSKEGGMPVGDLARRFDVSRPAISQHLAVLRDAGLVELRAGEGRNLYVVVEPQIAEARRALGALEAELPGGPPDAELALEARAAAPPAVAFATASTVAGQRLWLGPAEADAVAGGPFRIDLGGDAAAGTYAVVDAPGHLAFGWGQEGGSPPPDASRVDLRFTAVEGGTLIRLEHRGLPPEAHAAHLASWAHHLPSLVDAAEATARASAET